MSDKVVTLTFSNGETLRLNSESTLFVYSGDNEDPSAPYASGGRHYTLGNHYHPDAGYAPFLIGLLSGYDFFSVNSDNDLGTRMYQSSAVVSFSHSDSKANFKTFKEGL